MGKKVKPLERCMDYTDFSRTSKSLGMEEKNCVGDHEKWGNEYGSYPLQRNKEYSKAMRHVLVKEISILARLAKTLPIVVIIIGMGVVLFLATKFM